MQERFFDTVRRAAITIFIMALMAISCGVGTQPATAGDDGQAVGDKQAGPSRSPAELAAPTQWTPQAANTLIRMYNPRYSGNGQFRIENNRVTAAQLAGTGISDLIPLGSMSLAALDLRGLPVSDLGPLKGQPLRELYLEDTLVEDLTHLAGTALERLYLNNAPVTDLSPLSGVPLQTLK